MLIGDFPLIPQSHVSRDPDVGEQFISNLGFQVFGASRISGYMTNFHLSIDKLRIGHRALSGSRHDGGLSIGSQVTYYVQYT